MDGLTHIWAFVMLIVNVKVFWFKFLRDLFPYVPASEDPVGDCAKNYNTKGQLTVASYAALVFISLGFMVFTLIIEAGSLVNPTPYMLVCTVAFVVFSGFLHFITLKTPEISKLKKAVELLKS